MKLPFPLISVIAFGCGCLTAMFMIHIECLIAADLALIIGFMKIDYELSKKV